MDIRKQLAITEIKAAVLEAAYLLNEDTDYSKEDITSTLLKACSMLDEELKVEE